MARPGTPTILCASGLCANRHRTSSRAACQWGTLGSILRQTDAKQADEVLLRGSDLRCRHSFRVNDDSRGIKTSECRAQQRLI